MWRQLSKRILFVLKVLIIIICLSGMISSVTLIHLIRNLPYYDSGCIHNNTFNSSHQQIPKLIHMMWKSNDLSEEYRHNLESCKRVNSHYQLIFWNDSSIEQFLMNNYIWFMPTYRSYENNIEKADVARYFIIFHYGGIYMDLDMECVSDFKTIFSLAKKEFSIIIGEGLGGGLTNSFFGATKNHPFIKKLCLSLGHYFHIPKEVSAYWSIISGTGPLFVTRIYYDYPCRNEFFITPHNIHSEIHLIHHHAGSWHTKIKGNFWNQFRDTQLVKNILFFGILIICLYIIFKFIQR